ncbi:ROK family protein [Aureliella helgolandensis]|uniref:Glucokinase n=1 Tax=Aureliella helgolandensis TaxID=2527968 RepID=A0A518GGX0_9BACT|nr:ROK family protein [Aureliella helgolandensis]QDV27846.1 Glucokinase [Aureliella helgolandensis]
MTKEAEVNTQSTTSDPDSGAPEAAVKDRSARYWIGFDLGGTKMQCTLFDESLKQIGSRRRRTKTELGVEGGLDRIAATISKVLDDADVLPSQLAGIGIGCPGPVEWSKGVVRVAVNLGWKNVAVGKYLEGKFNCSVTVLNDVDAGVYGEYAAGAAKGARTTVGIFPGTGIGGGCVYDGQILRGKHLTCMEIGHTKINGSPRPGGTGMAGTLETEASRLAVAGELAKLAYRGEAPNLFKTAGTDLGAIRSKTIAESIAAGDKNVERVVEDACEMIGYAVANTVLMICPDVIVLGGGLVEAMPDRFVKAISKYAKKNVFECYRDEFEVRAAKLGDDAGTVGAAAWAQKVRQQSS